MSSFSSIRSRKRTLVEGTMPEREYWDLLYSSCLLEFGLTSRLSSQRTRPRVASANSCCEGSNASRRKRLASENGWRQLQVSQSSVRSTEIESRKYELGARSFVLLAGASSPWVFETRLGSCSREDFARARSAEHMPTGSNDAAALLDRLHACNRAVSGRTTRSTTREAHKLGTRRSRNARPPPQYYPRPAASLCAASP